MNESIVKVTASPIMAPTEVPALLTQIRPAWEAKDLINRVRRLLSSDPSSACQRIFNAAIHDLREKVIIAGIDIASDAAKTHRLPTIAKPEDVEEYPTSKLIDLVYRMGILSRAEWRRLARCYEIRRDLEHEDNEYEAQVEDCIYMFKTAIGVVLSRDPIKLLKVVDVKSVIEEATPVTPDHTLLNDYKHAPQPRQEEISRFLISIALDEKKPDIVRQNAYSMLRYLEPITQNPVKLTMANEMQERIGRNSLDLLHARVAYTAGLLPYLRTSQRRTFFEAQHENLRKIGHTFRSHAAHGEALRTLLEVGGLQFCPPPVRSQIIEWCILAYIGERGGYGMGAGRRVFNSDTAAPLVKQLIKGAGGTIQNELAAFTDFVKRTAESEHCARRFDELLDLVVEKC